MVISALFVSVTFFLLGLTTDTPAGGGVGPPPGGFSRGLKEGSDPVGCQEAEMWLDWLVTWLSPTAVPRTMGRVAATGVGRNGVGGTSSSEKCCSPSPGSTRVSSCRLNSVLEIERGLLAL